MQRAGATGHPDEEPSVMVWLAEGEGSDREIHLPRTDAVEAISDPSKGGGS